MIDYSSFGELLCQNLKHLAVQGSSWKLALWFPDGLGVPRGLQKDVHTLGGKTYAQLAHELETRPLRAYK